MAGFEPRLAQLADEPAVDLHELLTLLDRGCAPELAARHSRSAGEWRVVILRRPEGDRVSAVTYERSATRAPTDALDPDSRRWLEELGGDGHAHDAAVTRLHELLLRAARFEVSRRRGALPYLRGGDHDDLANQAADDALVAVLSKLDGFRGDSRFTTWAYKFALYEAAVKLRRRAWQERELPLQPDSWSLIGSGVISPSEHAEESELLAALGAVIAEALSAHQREVLVAITLNGVPIDVLAERLNTTRGALYKTLHDARRKLRRQLATDGFDIADVGGRQA